MFYKNAARVAFLAVTAILVLVPGLVPAQQPSNILVATGKEMAVELLDPGALDCAGGTPAGPPFRCSPGTSKILFWNSRAVQAYQDVAGTAEAMFRGRNTIVMNCNLDQNYFGHCWGVFELQVAEMGGKWEGAWSGLWDFSVNRVSYHMTGYGSGGQLEGLRFEKESIWPGGNQPGTFVVQVLAKQPALGLREPATGLSRAEHNAPLPEARKRSGR